MQKFLNWLLSTFSKIDFFLVGIDLYFVILKINSAVISFIHFLFVELIFGFLKKIYNQYVEFHRSLGFFEKFLWYSIIIYMIFLVFLYGYFHYELYQVSKKISVLNSLLKAYYHAFNDRKTLMIMIKYKMQHIARRRLWFARHLHECRHPFDDGRHYLIFRDFIPRPWAKYGSKR